MKTEPITVFVDFREPPSTFRRLQDANFQTESKRLEADIVVPLSTGQLLGIERKTYPDLIKSIRRKQPGTKVSHLQHQMGMLNERFSIGAVLLDGMFQPNASGGMTLPSGKEVASGGIYQADNYLLTVQKFLGILVVHCPDSERLGERVRHLITWCERHSGDYRID